LAVGGEEIARAGLKASVVSICDGVDQKEAQQFVLEFEGAFLGEVYV